MKTKKLGIILSIIALCAIFASLLLKFIIEPCCIIFVEMYHAMLLIVIPASLFVLFIGTYLIFKKEVKKKPKKISIIKEILTEDERKIIDILRKEKNVTQADLRKKLIMSKAKLSMLLEKMQQRNLLKKVKKGKTNIVILIKK